MLSISGRFNSQQKFNFFVFSFSIAVLIYSFLKSNFIEINGQCGNDGLTYCSMARGNIEFEPFSRRTFLPYIVGSISQDHIVLTFFSLNFIFLTSSAILIYVFQSKLNSNYSLLPISLFLINISTYRMLFAYPVLTDFLAIFLVLIFFYVYILLKNNLSYTILISILIILCFVRENLSITIAISIIISELIQKKFKVHSIIYLIVSIIFTYISFNQPSTENFVHESNLYKVFLISINGNFDNYETIFKFLYLTFIGLGPFAVFSFFLLRKINFKLLPIVIFSLLIFATQSNLNLANPEPRLMLIPSVLLPFIFFEKIRNIQLVILLFLATIAFWDVRQYSDGNYESYLEMFGQPYLSFDFNYEQFVSRILLFCGFLAFWLFFAIYKEFISRYLHSNQNS